jgi:hypothetical protein
VSVNASEQVGDVILVRNHLAATRPLAVSLVLCVVSARYGA